jgi:hypothetical protein
MRRRLVHSTGEPDLVPRFGKTRYGHVFSKGKAGVAWVGGGFRRKPIEDPYRGLAMPEVTNRPPWRVTDEVASLRVWEAIEQKVVILISCENCHHKSEWTPLFMEEKLRKFKGQRFTRVASQLRCSGCRSNYVLVWKR